MTQLFLLVHHMDIDRVGFTSYIYTIGDIHDGEMSISLAGHSFDKFPLPSWWFFFVIFQRLFSRMSMDAFDLYLWWGDFKYGSITFADFSSWRCNTSKMTPFNCRDERNMSSLCGCVIFVFMVLVICSRWSFCFLMTLICILSSVKRSLRRSLTS